MARSPRGAFQFRTKTPRSRAQVWSHGWPIALLVSGCVERNTVSVDAGVGSANAGSSDAAVRTGDHAGETSRVNDVTSSLDVRTSATSPDATHSGVEITPSTSEREVMSDSGASVTSASLDAALLPDAGASAQLDSTAEPEAATTSLVDTSHECESNGAAVSSAGASGAAGDAGYDVCGEAGFAGCYEPEPDAGLLLCGNGAVDRDANEECDDGNAAALDGCNACHVEPDWRCEPGKPCVSLLADQPCTDGCWAGDACIEVNSGVTCACPAVQPNVCAAVYLRSHPAFEGSRSCSASDVDADGATIIGTCYEASWQPFPVVWRRGSPPARLAARGLGGVVSADGSILAWSNDRTVTLMPPGTALSDQAFVAHPWGMNASGSTIVGQAFIWSQSGGAIQLFSPDGGTLSAFAYDVAEVDSPWGGRVVGSAEDADGNHWAAMWTMSGAPTWLDRLNGTTGSEAHAISADGSVVVGQVGSDDETEAVRWTSNGIERIGPQGAYAVNANGTRIAGHDHLGAWLYDDVTGLRRVKDVLVDLGMSLENWGPLSVSAMSSDGRTLVGSAQYLGDDQTNFQPRVISVYLPVE